MDKAIRFVDRLTDCAEIYDMQVALEPIAELDTVWPMYLDGLKFAKEEIGRPSVRVMADIDYFFKGNQPLELIADEQDYCLHVHIAGDHGQPGVGDLDNVFIRLFRILRDCGYTRGVSAACPWVSTDGEQVDFAIETAKSLAYLQALRDQVYAE